MEDKDIFNILVATDNHIGYLERDPIRGGDSLESFKEVLTIAQDKKVDFLLLGGDLFHENKPSRHVLFRTMELLRQFCMGPRPCPIEFRSDPSVNFMSSFPCVNYEDPNYNIDIPVFSIHGNHDDPTGEHSLSVMDLLSVNNLVNYFGKSQNVEDIVVSPLLLQKGSTKLALYGLGSIRDERLARMFRFNKVKFLRPKEDKEKWFNLLVLHQNRAKHSENNHIPASLLPSFLDLVVWGHEHESIPEVDYAPSSVADISHDDNSEDQGFYIYQPGSSIATSLGEGEVAKKHVGMLCIKGTDFKLTSVPLKTVRPFVFDHVILNQTGLDPLDVSALQSYLQQKVESMIDSAAIDNPDTDKIPLIRLRVDYTGHYSVIPPNRFGQNYVKKVANHSTILHWVKKRRQVSLRNHEKGESWSDNEEGDARRDYDEADEQERTSTIASLLEDQLKKEELNVLSSKRLVEAVQEYVDKSERDAISDFIGYSLQKTQEYLKTEDFPVDQIKDKIYEERESIMERQEKDTEEVDKHMASIRAARRTHGSQEFSNESDDDMMDTTTTSVATTTATNGGRGRGRGRGRARGSKSTASSSSTRGSRGTKGTAKRTKQTQLDTPTPVNTSTPLVIANNSTSKATAAAKKSTRNTTTTSKKNPTPKISYDNEDFEESRYSGYNWDGPSSSSESSEDPFAEPMTKKKRKK